MPPVMPRETATKQDQSHLTLYICAGVVAAIFMALLFPYFAVKFHVGGEIFLRLEKGNGPGEGSPMGKESESPASRES